MSEDGRNWQKSCQYPVPHEEATAGSAMHYDVTIITVRPGTHLEALARLKETFQPSAGGEVLACWYSDIGALNQILLIRAAPDTMRIHADRERILRSRESVQHR